MQLVTVQARHLCQQLLAPGQQMNLDHTAVRSTGATLQQTQGRTAVHQRHDAMVLGLQPLGEFPDRGPAARKPATCSNSWYCSAVSPCVRQVCSLARRN